MRRSNIIYHLINAAIFILLEVAALNMLHNNGPLQSTWLSKGSQAVMGTVWGGAQNVKHYFSLKKSNDSLALENQMFCMVPLLRSIFNAATSNRMKIAALIK